MFRSITLLRRLQPIPSASRRVEARLRERRAAKAFTLLELIVALTILAILAGLASLTFRSHLDQASLARAVEQIREADRLARETVQSSAGIPIRLEIQDDVLLLHPKGKRFDLPSGCSIRLRIYDGGAGQGGSIPYYTGGSSPSYAAKISSGQSTLWLLAFGLSGQLSQVDDERIVQELFANAP